MLNPGLEASLPRAVPPHPHLLLVGTEVRDADVDKHPPTDLSLVRSAQLQVGRVNHHEQELLLMVIAMALEGFVLAAIRQLVLGGVLLSPGVEPCTPDAVKAAPGKGTRSTTLRTLQKPRVVSLCGCAALGGWRQVRVENATTYAIAPGPLGAEGRWQCHASPAVLGRCLRRSFLHEALLGGEGRRREGGGLQPFFPRAVGCSEKIVSRTAWPEHSHRSTTAQPKRDGINPWKEVFAQETCRL